MIKQALCAALSLAGLSTLSLADCNSNYTSSGQIVVTSDNQVISHKHISATLAPGINTNGHSGVKIDDVIVVERGKYPGIYVNGGSNISITHADIVNAGVPALGT